jgi:hypothetical protein
VEVYDVGVPKHRLENNQMTTPGIQDVSDFMDALANIYNAAQTDPAAAAKLHQLAESCPPVPAPDAKPVEAKKP